MRNYTLSVMGGDSPSYNDPLKFRTTSLEEVIQIIELMLKNGHKVSILSEDAEPEKPSRELVEAVARELSGQAVETTTYEETTTCDLSMDETGTEKVEALAG